MKSRYYRGVSHYEWVFWPLNFLIRRFEHLWEGRVFPFQFKTQIKSELFSSVVNDKDLWKKHHFTINRNPSVTNIIMIFFCRIYQIVIASSYTIVHKILWLNKKESNSFLFQINAIFWLDKLIVFSTFHSHFKRSLGIERKKCGNIQICLLVSLIQPSKEILNSFCVIYIFFSYKSSSSIFYIDKFLTFKDLIQLHYVWQLIPHKIVRVHHRYKSDSETKQNILKNLKIIIFIFLKIFT